MHAQLHFPWCGGLGRAARSVTSLVLLAEVLGVPRPLQGQTPVERGGFWLQLGLTWGSRSCESCEGRVGGAGGIVALGLTASPALRLGVAANGWIGHVERRAPGFSESGSELLFAVAPMVRYHPGANQRFSLFGGAGLGLTVTGLGKGETGGAALIGVNYDFPSPQSAAFSLFGQGTVARVAGQHVNLVQVGAGLNLY